MSAPAVLHGPSITSGQKGLKKEELAVMIPLLTSISITIAIDSDFGHSYNTEIQSKSDKSMVNI